MKHLVIGIWLGCALVSAEAQITSATARCDLATSSEKDALQDVQQAIVMSGGQISVVTTNTVSGVRGPTSVTALVSSSNGKVKMRVSATEKMTSELDLFLGKGAAKRYISLVFEKMEGDGNCSIDD